MQDRFPNRKRDQARRKYLILDEYLAEKGSEKIALVESLHHIAEQIDKHQKTAAKLEDDFVKVSAKLNDLNKEIRPKTLEHQFCYRLMNEYKRPPRRVPNAVAVEQIDEEGNVIEEYESITEASNKTGIYSMTISRICSKDARPKTHNFRYKK